MSAMHVPFLLLVLGIFIQSLYLLNGLLLRKDIQLKYILVVVLAFLLILSIKTDARYSLYLHCVYFLYGFILLYSAYFSRYVLPNIHEESLIVLNIIFLFNFFYYFLPEYYHFLSAPNVQLGQMIMTFPEFADFAQANGTRIFIIIFGAPTVLLLFNVLIPGSTPGYIKTILSAWYLFMNAALLIPVLIEGNFFNVLLKQDFQYNWLQIITTGMVTVTLSLYLLNFLSLIPIGENGIDRMNNEIELLNSKYLEEDINPVKNFILIVVIVSALMINHYILKFNNIVILNLSILSLPYFYGSVYKTKPINRKS